MFTVEKIGERVEPIPSWAGKLPLPMTIDGTWPRHGFGWPEKGFFIVDYAVGARLLVTRWMSNN